MKEVKDLNKFRDILCPWVGRLNIVKMLVLPNMIHRFNAIPFKILASYFVGYWQTDSKVYMEKQEPQHKIKEQSWRNETSWLQDLLQCDRNQNCGTGGKKQPIDQ